MEPIDARTNMRDLDTDECLRLLQSHSHEVGRLGIVDRGVPTIMPVNYVMVGEHVVFRSAPGAKLDAAYRRARVAFEIDHVDLERKSGWSVVVHGRAEALTRSSGVELLMAVGLHPWVDFKPSWVVIRPDRITGRQIPNGAF